MIEVRELSKVYRRAGREIRALDGVDLTVRQGEVFGVVGQSGAGKSTLVRCVNLLERPTGGTVRLDGQVVTDLPPAELRRQRRRVGMVFQQFNLFDSRTVAGNVGYPLEIAGVGRRERARRVGDLLELVGLDERARAFPAELSGGQKQRVGIARALAADPAVLLSDEATSALDPETTTSILRLLRDLNQRLGLTILLITHEMGVVKEICDSVALLRAGRVVESGPIGELVARPDSVLARDLLPAPPGRPAREDRLVVDVTVTPAAADGPVLATLVRRFDVDVEVVGGSLETVGGQRVGRLQLELPGAGGHAEALAYLERAGLRPVVVTS
ncbi:MAG: Methionine ABC transporter ATP-binding protein [uncultured Corynebacteriales bacterium]|uniref:Methionine ABC transporter ATP-binding protein n=1 Tax=uncultured Mycobacteriales bacterium TaxID=581187 RepID=A0A6J4HTA0_9ACTN|nr:MAG: Methionine ABC transporter ATP-binding protein [uncultured Corynebacteriales bacterium]